MIFHFKEKREWLYIAIDINDFFNELDEQKRTTLDTLSATFKAIRGIQTIDDNNKRIKGIIYKNLKAPKHLNTLEKIVYYFNRKQGITLQEIADVGGYSLDYMLEISARINKKIKAQKTKIKPIIIP